MNKSDPVTSPLILSEEVEHSNPLKLPAKPMVSISMITYQHAPYIREALDSVLMQNVDFPYEICIGEDGSTDGTREICLEYAQKYPDKFRLFLRDRTNPARKAFAAPYMFNSASTFDACRGKYIALLEGDDYWLNPNKLQTQVDQLEANPSLGASCHYAASVREATPWTLTVIPRRPVESFAVDSLLTRDIENMHTSTWLLRRGKPVPWQNLTVSHFGDYPIIVCAMLQGEARVIPRVWSMYRVHAGGVFSPQSSETRLQWNVELWKCLESIVPPSLHSASALGTSRTLAMLTGELSKSRKYRQAWKCFKENISGIARIQPSLRERKHLHWRAVESLIFPRLQGLRNRLSALRN